MQLRNGSGIVFSCHGWCCFIVMLIALYPAILRAQEQDSSAGWKRYLAQRTQTVTQANREALASVRPDNWQETQSKWREELKEMLGLSPWPERTDLKVNIAGRNEYGDYAVTRLSFQSQPGLYVAANLYEPLTKAPAEGWPAILYVCGHANVRDEGRLQGNKTGYHHHGIWFARHNTVCLIIDTIQLGELHGEHHGTYKLGRWDWITRGYTPAGVEAWNAIRALDYLETLPSVDKKRIGITGRSGGGAYSWFTAALDDRIRVAVPVAGITDLQNHIVDDCVEGHCDCMYFVNYFGWDYNRLAALIAPRPLLLANSDNDRIFPLDGVMRVHGSLVQVYENLKSADKLGVLITPGPHLDTQELQVGAFRWLLQHLNGQPIVVDRAATKELKPEQLVVFQEETPADQRVASLGNWFVPSALDEAEPAAELKRWQAEGAANLKRLWKNQSWLKPENMTVRKVDQGRVDAWRWDMYEFTDSSHWDSHALVVAPESSPTSAPVMVHIGSTLGLPFQPTSAKELISNRGSLRAILDSEPNLCHVFLRPRGEDLLFAERTVKEAIHVHRRFYLLGDSMERLALSDLAAQLQWLRDSSPLHAANIRLAGHGRWSPLAALLALESKMKLSSGVALPTVSLCQLFDYPASLEFAPVLPGMNRFITLKGLVNAVGEAVQVQVLKGPTNELQPPLRRLMDPSHEPQQSNGIRIVEVTADQASIWGRATLWLLPNLGDMPKIEFEADPQFKNPERGIPILPPGGTASLGYAVPGTPAELQFKWRTVGQGKWQESEWISVNEPTDFSTVATLKELKPDTAYDVQVLARANGSSTVSSTTTGSFRTLPAPHQSKEFRLAIGTCQEFEDRDGEYGMDLYRTLLHRQTDAFILAGDVVYYDKLARSVPMANFHWQRMYSMPTLVNFHRRVPTYFLKDDHDTYLNDSWPGQYTKWTRDFRFEDGQRIFKQQTGSPDPAYRTVRMGRDLQVWMMEGRDYRDPNNIKDGPMKSIWGSDQWNWLQKSLSESDATYKIIVSPTPIVGPDRDNKHDNHANDAFAEEGKKVREFLSKIPRLVVVCGDRHWQYHSIDPVTGLHEFSVGPVSNRHAGGWDAKDKREMHQYLRVAGGYLEVVLHEAGESLTLTHRDPYGVEHHQHVLKK